MQVAQRTRTCPACGGRGGHDARWCGHCGAALARHGAPPAVAVQGAPDTRPTSPTSPPSHPPGPVRRWAVAAVALATAFAVGVASEPAPPRDVDLLGRPGDDTGRSSLLPPVDDLQLLWRRRVDEVPRDPPGPSRLLDLGSHVVVGETVLDLTGGAAAAHLPADVVPSRAGTVVLAGEDELVVVDARTGSVARREPLTGAGTWTPSGASLGWVAGAAVLADEDGVLGAVELDGRVRWVGDPGWRWTPAGDGSDWAVVVAAGEPGDRVLVLDGSDGSVARDVGPVGVVHAPVVHGDTFAWVDPFGGLDRGLGHPVEVHGIRLDGTGRVWAVTDLPPTSGLPQAVRLAAAGAAGLVVHHWAAGQATAVVWLDPADGSRRGAVTVGGTGTTAEGWPVVWADGDAVAHVSPARREVRVVDRGGEVRWAAPAGSAQGVLLAGDVALVRTGPRGASLQSRLRLHAATSGAVLWDRVTDDTQRQRLVTAVGGVVAVTPDAAGDPTTSATWFDLDTGRRRAARAPDTPGVGGGPPAPPGMRADDDLAVVVGPASVTATDPDTGAHLWRVATPVALRPAATVLLDEVVVVLGWDGGVRALDREDGSVRWRGPDGVTATTAGGDEVVLGLETGQVVVLATDGAVRQRVRVGHGAVEDVAVLGGRVVATVGGDVVGLGRGAAVVEPVDRVELP